MEQCDNDADTSIVREALAATDESVEVRAEDADVLAMLVNHSSSTNFLVFLTTSKDSYDVRKIRDAHCVRKRSYLLFCHAFTGCDTVSAIDSHGKTLIDYAEETLMNTWTSSLTYRQLRMWISRLVLQSSSTYTMDHVLRWVRIVTTCSRGKKRSRWSNQRLYLQQKVQLHNFSPCLSPSPGLDASAKHVLAPQPLWMDSGPLVGAHGYEPIPALNDMALEEVLGITTCNNNGDCSNQRCICKKNNVKCISACGNCKGITCKNCAHDGVESVEDSDIDSLHSFDI